MRKDLILRLGKAARLARKERGLTQANTAERLDVSVEFYGRIERGVACPSMEIFVRLVAILDVSADVLLGLDAAHLPAGPPPLTTPEDPPELRELAELLPGARPETLRVVRMLLTEIDHARAERKRSKSSKTGSKPGKSKPGKGKQAKRARAKGARKPPSSA